MADERIRVVIEGNSEDLKRALRSAARELNEFERDVDRAGVTSVRTSSRNRELTRSLKDSETAFTRLRNASRDFSKAGDALKWPTIISGAGAAAGALTALSGSAVSLAASIGSVAPAAIALPAVMGAVVQGMGVFKLATADLSEALGGNKKALERLTPAAKEFVGVLKTFKPELDAMKRAAQEGLFKGVTDGLRDVRPAFDSLNEVVAHTSKSMGDLAREAGHLIGGKEFSKDLRTIGDRNALTLHRMGQAALSLLSGFRNIMVAAGPFIGWLSKSTQAVARHFDEWTKGARKSGELNHIFFQVRLELERLKAIFVPFGKALFNIFAGAKPAGDSLLESLGRTMSKFEEWTASVQGKRQIQEFFRQAAQGAQDIAKAIADLAKLVGPALGFLMNHLKGVTTATIALGAAWAALKVQAGILAVADAAARMAKVFASLRVAVQAVAVGMAEGGLLGAMRALFAFMLANPVTALVVALGAAAGALLAMRSATSGATKAQKDFKDSLDATTDAVQAQQDAQRTLADDDLTLRERRLAVKQSTEEVTRSEKALAAARKSGNLREIHDAEDRLEQARIGHARALRDLQRYEQDHISNERAAARATRDAAKAYDNNKAKLLELGKQLILNGDSYMPAFISGLRQIHDAGVPAQTILASIKDLLAAMPEHKRIAVEFAVTGRLPKPGGGTFDPSTTTQLTARPPATKGATRRSTGGPIPGFGGGDVVPAMLEPGEYVVRKEVVQKVGQDFLETLNDGRMPGFASGGSVRRASRHPKSRKHSSRHHAHKPFVSFSQRSWGMLFGSGGAPPQDPLEAKQALIDAAERSYGQVARAFDQTAEDPIRVIALPTDLGTLHGDVLSGELSQTDYDRVVAAQAQAQPGDSIEVISQGQVHAHIMELVRLAALKSDIKHLWAEKAQLTAAIAAKTLTAWRERVRRVEELKGQLQASVERLRDLNRTLDAVNDALKSERRQRKPNRTRVNALVDRAQKLRNAISNESGHMSRVKSHLGSAQSDRDSLAATYTGLTGDLNTNIPGSMTDIDLDLVDLGNEARDWAGKMPAEFSTSGAGGGIGGGNGAQEAALAEQLANLQTTLYVQTNQMRVLTDFRPLLIDRLVGAFAHGGVIPQTGLALVHRGETVVPDPQGPFGSQIAPQPFQNATTPPHVEVHLHGDIGGVVEKVSTRIGGKVERMVSENLGRRARILSTGRR